MICIHPGDFSFISKESLKPKNTEILYYFEMGETEVTQAQFELLMEFNPSRHSRTGKWAERVDGIDTSSFPVEMVTWYDAIEYCNRVSRKEGLQEYYKIDGVTYEDKHIVDATVTIVSGDGFRLPTDVEWEYACRAGTETKFAFGDDLTTADANIASKWDPGPSARPTHVKSYNSNNWGLYDCHGNVSEWTFDLGLGWKEGRIIRGGSYQRTTWWAESGTREDHRPNYAFFSVGFRVARHVSKDEKSNRK